MRIKRPECEPDISFRVVGHPGTAGSKTSGVAYRKGEDGRRVPIERNGKIVTFTKDSSGEAGKLWRSAVAEAGETARGGADLLSGPLYVEITVLRQRSQSHFGSGKNAAKLKASAPLYPHKRPDVTKHTRAIEDALTGSLWIDDALIVSAPAEKVFAESNESEGAEVRVWRLPATVGEVVCIREVEDVRGQLFPATA